MSFEVNTKDFDSMGVHVTQKGSEKKCPSDFIHGLDFSLVVRSIHHLTPSFFRFEILLR